MPNRSRARNNVSLSRSQIANAITSVIFIQMDYGFGVAVGAVAMAALFQLLAQFCVIVDLTVKHDPDGAGLVAAWSMSAGHINDAKPAHSNSSAAIGIDTLIVGTPVRHSGAHLAHGCSICASALSELHHSRDAAHRRSPDDQLTSLA